MPRWQNLRSPREEKFIRGYSIYPTGGCGEFPWYHERIEGFGSQLKRDSLRAAHERVPGRTAGAGRDLS